MNSKNFAMLRSSFFASTGLVVAAFALMACGTSVVGGGGSPSGGNGGGGAAGGGGTAGGDPGSNAIAMLHSEFPPPSGGPGGSSSVGGAGPDPATLYIAVGKNPQICADPFGYEGCDYWRVSVNLPPALQQVGTILLSDPSVISYASVGGPDEGGGQCYGGGGSIEGTLEITAIDDTHVEGILSGIDTAEFDANGPFYAERCQF